jgi:PHS family inorganic phosphate transporter-like MFS transporter
LDSNYHQNELYHYSTYQNHSTTSNYLVQASGWMVMFGLTFFFASWGPATTTYIIPAELFPTKWRVTGYSLCAAAGKFIVSFRSLIVVIIVIQAGAVLRYSNKILLDN